MKQRQPKKKQHQTAFHLAIRVAICKPSGLLWGPVHAEFLHPLDDRGLLLARGGDAGECSGDCEARDLPVRIAPQASPILAFADPPLEPPVPQQALQPTRVNRPHVHGKIAGLATESRLDPGPVVGGGLDTDHLGVAEAQLEGTAGGEGQGVEPQDAAPGDAGVGEGQEVAGLLGGGHSQPPPGVRRGLPIIEIVGLRRRQLGVRPPRLRRRRVPRAAQVQKAPVLPPAHIDPIAPVPQPAAQGLALGPVETQGRAVGAVVALMVPVAEAVGLVVGQVDAGGLEVALGVALVVADEGVRVGGDLDILPGAIPAVEGAVGVVRLDHWGDRCGRGLLGGQIHNSIHSPQQVPRTRHRHRGHRLGHPAHPLTVNDHDPVPVGPQAIPGDLQGGLLRRCDHVVHPHVRPAGHHHGPHGGGGDKIGMGGVVTIVLLTDGPSLGGDQDPGVLGLGVRGSCGHGGRKAASVGQQEPSVLAAVDHVPRTLHPANRGVVGQRARRPQPRVVQAQGGRGGQVAVRVPVAEAAAPCASGSTLGEALVARNGGWELGHGHLGGCGGHLVLVEMPSGVLRAGRR
mmetsp:Transcript_30914/g.67839  ORF Transcript_30914/g.67839 Transcript_30914/m.67839 type:complete len:571 (-) Transcript_30914:1220-2932(-)